MQCIYEPAEMKKKKHFQGGTKRISNVSNEGETIDTSNSGLKVFWHN